jgi:hypothetical protein
MTMAALVITLGAVNESNNASDNARAAAKVVNLNATQSRKDIINAGREAIYLGCIRDKEQRRAERESIHSSNRNLPVLVAQGALSSRLAQAAVRSNRERLERVKDLNCSGIADQYVRKAREE